MFASCSTPPPLFFLFLLPAKTEEKGRERVEPGADRHTEFLLPIRIWVNYRIRI